MSGVPVFINARFLTQDVTGVQRYAHELVRAMDALVASGEIDGSLYRIELLAPTKGLLRDPGLSHIPLIKTGRLTGHAWEQIELPLRSRGGVLFCPGNTAPVASLLLRRPTVVTVHDLSYLYFPEAYGPAFRAFYRTVVPLVLTRAGAVITVSEAEKASILKLYPHASGRLTAIQSGAGFLCDREADAAPPSARPGGPFVLYVGSLNRRKNLAGFLRAMEAVCGKADVRAVVVGSLARSFSPADFRLPAALKGRVTSYGQIGERELARLYGSACCLVFPSFYEASGLPPLEAMACGCPVVASSIPALRERLGEAALYCDPNDPSDIADKVLLLLKDPALREDLRKKGLERSKLFTWENCARETFGVLKRVADGRLRLGT